MVPCIAHGCLVVLPFSIFFNPESLEYVPVHDRRIGMGSVPLLELVFEHASLLDDEEGSIDELINMERLSGLGAEDLLVLNVEHKRFDGDCWIPRLVEIGVDIFLVG